ncbi:conserved hypothetical protein [Leishmania major strain Friedlin]|uniref:Uncharacterized protein n=1 Tax=Leishmania major TaxID=5664 RepID=E9AD92_LEIMA|nr:conserved hypothetical protein [Leishmania major strain Friedlin]CAG9576718.1 hypothetical_protein_-_conserved [Leishmania major strain Friedlin]CBZ12178.1 conserved hypothetical protein [Leishmania major strain Friedlin]|eukprot:XP_003721921.1 conserved hypothetical protein [Leishmania major strain Friedlin]
MSIRAVCWLQSKLGLDIGGRSSGDDGSGTLGSGELAGFSTTQNRSYSTDPVATVNGTPESSRNDRGIGGGAGTFSGLASGWDLKLGQVWRQASDKATQYWNTNMRRRGSTDPFGFRTAGAQGDFGGNTAAGDNPELDENGLPVTRNWYYYDVQLGRWTVSRDAPESVQQEYYEKLEEAERERLGQKKVGPPPPAAIAGGPPPLLGAAGGGHGSQSPHYAIPDYFGNAGATPAAPPQQAQPYGVYGGAPPQHAQSTAPGVFPPSAGMSTHPGTYYPPTPPISSTTASATMQATTYRQPLSVHSQVAPPPPPAQAYLPAMPSISVPTYPVTGGAYPAASVSPTSNTHALSLQPPSHVAASEPPKTAMTVSSLPPPILASPTPSHPLSQPHVYSSPAHNGMSASPPAPALSQHYASPLLQSQAPEPNRSASGNSAAGVSSLPFAHASAPAPAPCTSAAPDAYPYGGGSVNNSVQDSTTAVASAGIPTPSQRSFGLKAAVHGPQPPPSTSNPYAYPSTATTTAAAQAFAPAPAVPVQPQPLKVEANGNNEHPSASSLGTFQTTSAAAARPSAIGLPPPPSFKPFSPS